MSKLLLVIGICQIIAGVVIVGLIAKNFHDTATSDLIPEVEKVQAFGPVLIGLLVIVNGVFGVLTMCCAGNKKMDVFYLMGATVAASASAAMVWIYAINIKRCDDAGIFSVCSEENYNINVTILVFSIICCAMSVFGMVTTSLGICRKL